MGLNGEGYRRYQTIFEVDDDGLLFYVIEVHIQDGKLVEWSDPNWPAGTTQAELLVDLQRRLSDCNAYEPVSIDALRVGLEFTAKP